MDSAAVIISALGGFGGIAAVISSIAAFRKSKGAEESADKASMSTQVMLDQFRPNHGSSVYDKIASVERNLDLLCDELRMLGQSAQQTHQLLTDRITAHDRELRDVKDLIDEKCGKAA